MKRMIKNIKLNKFNEKLLGLAVFLNVDLIQDYVKNPKDTYLSVEIENTKEGILIKPLESWTINEVKGFKKEPALSD